MLLDDLLVRDDLRLAGVASPRSCSRIVEGCIGVAIIGNLVHLP